MDEPKGHIVSTNLHKLLDAPPHTVIKEHQNGVREADLVPVLTLLLTRHVVHAAHRVTVTGVHIHPLTPFGHEPDAVRDGINNVLPHGPHPGAHPSGVGRENKVDNLFLLLHAGCIV